MSDTPSKNSGKWIMMQAAGVIDFWRSLRARLVLLVLLASAPLLAITLYTANEIRNGEVERARVELQGLSRLAEGRLQQAVQASEHLLHAFSQMPAIARGDAAECARVFGHFLGKAQRYTNFVVTDAEGSALCDGVNPSRLLNLGGRAHFKQARATKRFVVGHPAIGLSSGRAAMTLAYPLLDAGGNFRGAILSGLDLQWFGELFANATLYPHLTFSVWAADGTIMYRHPEPEKWVSKRFPETEITQAVLSRQAETVVVEAAGLTGAQNLYAITGLERWAGNRVAFSVGIPKAELFARSDRAFFHTLTYFGIVLVLTLAAALVVAEYSIRRRVAALADASERLAAGDLSARSGLPPGADELGALANSFDAMAQAMQRQIEDIRRGEEKIRALNADLEQRVAARTTELQSANRELEAFSHSVSHDLRAPLRAISGFAGMLRRDHAAELAPDAAKLLERIEENVKHMGALIDDLLEFARLGRKAFSPQRVNLVHVVRECLENLKHEQQGRKVEFAIGELPPCHGDLILLERVLANLLGNALKYTRKREVARIEVRAEKRNGDYVFYVRDNGAGFDMRYSDKLFQVFQRLHGQTEFEGTGVGLAIVRRAIEKHGGKVWAESAPDQGATFYFSLPTGNGVQGG